MTAIEIYPQPEQELVLDANDWYACIRLGDITIHIPGSSHEKRAGWLMGFWEQLTDYMALHSDEEHLVEWVQKLLNKEKTSDHTTPTPQKCGNLLQSSAA